MSFVKITSVDIIFQNPRRFGNPQKLFQVSPNTRIWKREDTANYFNGEKIWIKEGLKKSIVIVQCTCEQIREKLKKNVLWH